MTKIKSLSVHKNTKEQRRRKELRSELIDAAKYSVKDSGISGYCIVVWDKNNSYEAYWESGHLPGDLVGEYVKNAVNRKISIMDAESIMYDE